MSIHRRAARRDDNEPTIRKRFAAHGWHTEQRSSSGGWDLDCYPEQHPPTIHRGVARTVVVHVDVKMPDGKVTEPQKKKWGELRDKGIPVYVVRTAEDVDALVRGELAAWEPAEREAKRGARPGQVTPRGKSVHFPCKQIVSMVDGAPLYPPARRSVAADEDEARAINHRYDASMRPLEQRRRAEALAGDIRAGKRPMSSGYTPPRSKPVDAAKEAEETFAPPPTRPCVTCGVLEATVADLLCFPCSVAS